MKCLMHIRQGAQSNLEATKPLANKVLNAHTPRGYQSGLKAKAPSAHQKIAKGLSVRIRPEAKTPSASKVPKRT